MILIIPSTWCFVAAGVLFGPFWGTFLTCLGSFLASLFMYLLVKKLGKNVLDAFVPEKSLKKYYKFLDNEKRFERIFSVMQIFPFTPDNTFDYISGTSKMTTKKLCLLVLGFKLWKIIILCVGSDYVLNILFSILGF